MVKDFSLASEGMPSAKDAKMQRIKIRDFFYDEL